MMGALDHSGAPSRAGHDLELNPSPKDAILTLVSLRRAPQPSAIEVAVGSSAVGATEGSPVASRAQVLGSAG